MRVLSVITAYPPSTGGAQIHAHQLHLALQRAGHDVSVATVWRETRTDWALGTTLRAPAPRDEDELDGVAVHHVGLTPAQKLRAGLALAAYPPAMRLVAPRLTDVYAPAATALLDRLQPDVVHLSRIGREWLYQAFVRAALARGIPYVVTANHHPHWTRPWHWWWWELYRRAGAVLVLSDHEADTLVQGGVDRHRIFRTVVGPVGEPPDDVQEDHTGIPRVAFLGQIRHYKGLGLLADAMELVRRELPHVELDVVGPWLDAPASLRRRLARAPWATLHGAVSDERKWAILADTSVLCVPSWGEALGGVYLEAWRAGIPAVGADVPPVRELFQRTGGGVVSERDASALARKLRELLGDPDGRERMAAAGRRALEEYSWSTAAARAGDAYEMAMDVMA